MWWEQPGKIAACAHPTHKEEMKSPILKHITITIHFSNTSTFKFLEHERISLQNSSDNGSVGYMSNIFKPKIYTL